MASRRTIVFDLLDPSGHPLGVPGTEWVGSVDVEYDRDVSLKSGGRIPRRVASGVSLSPSGSGEPPEVEVIPNNDEDLAEGSEGFCVIITLRLSRREGSAVRGDLPPRTWTVTVSTNAAPSTPLSALPTASTVPPQYASMQEWIDAIMSEGSGFDPDASTALRMGSWQTKLRNQDETQARAVMLGDSNAEGWFSDEPLLTSRSQGVWQRLIRVTLGGKGYSPAAYIQNGLPIDGTVSSQPGTNGVSVGENAGIGLKYLGLPVGQWREWKFTGDRVSIWYSGSDFLAANAEVLIDGTKVADLNGVAGAEGVTTKRWTSDALTRGEHTVRVRAVGVADFVFLLEAAQMFNGDYAEGAHVIDGAHFGASTSTYMQNLRWKSGLALADPHLVVIHLGVNDSSLYGAATFQANLAAMVDEVRGAAPNASVAISMAAERQDQPPLEPWSAYVSAARLVSDQKKAYFLDLGRWMDPRGPLVSADKVHWSPAGQRFVGEVWAHRLGGSSVHAALTEAAEESAEAAARAVSLVDAPADTVIAGLADATESQTRAALDALYVGSGDPRLTNARTPLPHKTVTADVVRGSGGGPLATSVLGNGTASAGTVLYGDGWKVPEGGMFVNAAAFGLVGNGTTNDAAALQAALDAASAAGTFGGVGRVWIPGGKSYGIGTTIRLPANVVIEGGTGARLVTTNGNTMMCNYASGDTTTTAYNGRGNIVIRNLIMDMRAHEQTAAHDCLLFSHAENLRVENVVFRNCSSYHHLEFNACKNGRVLNCRFEGWKNNTGSASNDYREAVQIDYAIGSTTPGAQDNTPSRDITVDGCWFGPSAECGSVGRAVGSHTVASGGSAYESIKVANCTIESPIFEGIRAYSWKNSVIQSNVILDAARTAIALDAATGVSASNAIVANNSITGGCSVSGITVRSTNSGTNAYSNTNITGNVINAIAGAGIVCENTNHPVVVGNKLNSLGGDGIRCTDSIGSNLSSNALVTVGGDGIRVQGGRQHTITSNYSWGVTGTATIYVGTDATHTLVQGNNIYSSNTTPTGVAVGAANCSVIGNQLVVAKAQCIAVWVAGSGAVVVGNVATGSASTWVSYSSGTTAYMTYEGSAVAPNIAGSNIVR